MEDSFQNFDNYKFGRQFCLLKDPDFHKIIYYNK